MSESLFLRLKSLNVRTMRGVSSAKNVIKVAAMHNLREIVAEFGARADSGINPARIALNYQLRGPDTAAGVADLAQALLDNAGVQKLRRDACMALELVFSLPEGSAVDHREYFAAAVAWADGFFNVPILSATAHLDEQANHCHLLLLPLVAGRMQGGALAGGPTKIKMMLADFQQQVGQRFGLAHQPRAKRLSKTSRDAAGRKVLDMLKAHPERLNVPAVRDALIAALGQHHETLLPLLGIEPPTAPKTKAKSFIEMMTSPCRPERTTRAYVNEGAGKPISIDVALSSTGNNGQENSNVYLCVDVAPSAPSFPPADQRQQTGTTEQSDSDQPASQQDGASESAQPSSGEASSELPPSANLQEPLPALASPTSSQAGDQQHRQGSAHAGSDGEAITGVLKAIRKGADLRSTPPAPKAGEVLALVDCGAVAVHVAQQHSDQGALDGGTCGDLERGIAQQDRASSACVRLAPAASDAPCSASLLQPCRSHMARRQRHRCATSRPTTKDPTAEPQPTLARVSACKGRELPI